VELRLHSHVVLGLAHDDDREPSPSATKHDAEVERLGPQAVLRGDEAGRERAAATAK
jgi:hypothetical protein